MQIRRLLLSLTALATVASATVHAEGMSLLGVTGQTERQGVAVPGAGVPFAPQSYTPGTGSGAVYAPQWTSPRPLPNSGQLVYYVLVPTGDDESYFEALARGTPATVINLCRADAQAALGASGARGDVQFVRVKLASVEDYTRVLHEGLLPAHPRAGTPIYRMNELTPRTNRVLGFTILSHAGCDGPFITYRNGGSQAPYPIFQWDRASANANSFYNRLVVGARLRFAGCNTANDYMWYEADVPGYRANPSVAHAAAAIYADKRVVAYGHYNSGDVRNTDYIHFSCPQGKNYPVRVGKPKDGYSFGTTQGASQYEPALIHYRSAEERDAYMRYYASRGYPLAPKNERRTAYGLEGDLVMRAPRPVWLSRGSAKPEVLKAVVNTVAAYPGAGAQAVTHAFSQYGAQADAYRGLIPRLAALAQYGKLQKAIRDTYQARGWIDHDDFRLWAMMFGPSKDYTVYRADLCDDPNVARTPYQQ